MKVKPEQLAAHLAKSSLAPVYFIHGDEPLQREEAADAVRAATRAQGEVTREVYFVESGFDWNAFSGEADAMSLFAERRLIELRLNSAKLGIEGSRMLEARARSVAEGDVLLVLAGKLDGKTLKNRWCKALAAVGVEIQVWPVKAAQMSAWVARRMRARGMQPANDAVAMIAERAEGNLLAARQDIERLSLVCGAGPVDATTVQDMVGDSARFDVFALSNAALLGDRGRTVRVLNHLRAEGIAPVLVLWALNQEAQTLSLLSTACAQGESANQWMARNRIPSMRQAPLQRALERSTPQRWRQILRRCARTDRVAKGVRAGEAWDELLGLGLAMAG